MGIKRWILNAVILLACTLPASAQQRNARPVVHVSVTVATTAEDKSLILYKPGKLLKMTDFKGPPDGSSHGVAATYSGFSMSTQGESRGSVMNIQVELTIYFDPAKSWTKEEGKTERVLAHEQLHFDLTALKACELAKAIRNEDFTAENAQAKIKSLRVKYTAELGKMQQAYDKETKHGTLPDEQAAWARKIAQGLAAVSCM